jgi:hypothetical protein
MPIAQMCEEMLAKRTKQNLSTTKGLLSKIVGTKAISTRNLFRTIPNFRLATRYKRLSGTDN